MSYLTSKTQYITVDGNKIAYRELSKGKSKLPLLMLVHLAATLDNWDPKLLDLIAEKHHVMWSTFLVSVLVKEKWPQPFLEWLSRQLPLFKPLVTIKSIFLAFLWGA